MIAPPRSLHEVLAASRPSAVARPTWPRSSSMARRRRRDSFRIVRPGATRYHRAPARPAPAEPVRRVKIQEADAKSLLVAQGLPVPAWEVAHTAAEARAAAERFLGGRRASAGRHQGPGARRRPRQGRRREARRPAPTRPRTSPRPILGMDIKGITVRKVLVGAGGRHRQGVLPVGASSTAPTRRHPADGLGRGRRRDRAGRRRPPRGDRPRATPTRCSGCSTTRRASSRSRWASARHLEGRRSAIAKGLVRTMLAYDADLVEINPLAIVRETRRRRRRRSSASSASTPRSRSTTRRSPATPSSRRCATPTRRTRPTARRARPA